MKYKDKLQYSDNIQKIFVDINNFHNKIHDIIELDDEEKYKEISEIIYAKLSLIESTLLSLREKI